MEYQQQSETSRKRLGVPTAKRLGVPTANKLGMPTTKKLGVPTANKPTAKRNLVKDLECPQQERQI